MNILFINTTNSQEIKAVDNFDLKKYLGKWYEIASYPQIFQKGCHCTTAEYTLSEKGYVIVENRCKKGSINGPESYIKGKAFLEKGVTSAQLKVQFFWPFKAKYWVIILAPDYSYAVVSHPNKKYLWILSRQPSMDHKIYSDIVDKLQILGFDIHKLAIT
jgi:apolipoprotein D and lipocalin family protein